MSDAQHTQEKEALEDASNRLLMVNGVVLGALAYTMVGTWTTQDGGVVTGPGYTVKFTPSQDCVAAIAAWLAGQQPAPPVSPPPPPPPAPVSPPPPSPVSGTEPAIGAPVGTQDEWEAMKPKDA